MDSNKQKTKKKTTETEEKTNIQSELNELILKNQDLIENEKECEQKIANLKSENELKLSEVNSKNNSEIFDLIINSLKNYLKAQDLSQEIENQKQQLKDEASYTYVRANVFSKNFEPVDKFSAGILANIKK